MLRKNKKINDFDKSSQIYFKEIGNYKSLSLEDEQRLWLEYKNNNNITARDELIKSNLKFVASVAKNYQGRGLSYSDLIAEGNCGLLRAMEKFDYKKGYKTISYSVWWIRQSILEALRERNGIEGEDLPTDIEKQNTNDDDIDTDTYINNNYIDNSTSKELNYDGIKNAATMLVDCLTKREEKIINEYFGLNCSALTLEEIGKGMNLTKERVRQIKEKALKKLRAEALINSITSDIYK